jgi:hypothetical protein
MNELSEKDLLNKRLENISWGLFLVMLGGLWLVPDQWIPEGSWLIGAGLIMLGLNLVRYVKGIKMSGFTLVLGAIAIFSGISDILQVDLPVFPILLILIGANIIIRPLLEKDSTYQKENKDE